VQESEDVMPVFTDRGVHCGTDREKKFPDLQNAAGLAETGTNGVHKNGHQTRMCYKLLNTLKPGRPKKITNVSQNAHKLIHVSAPFSQNDKHLWR